MIKSNKGFTFIELLIVISIISILVVVVFVLLDPATLFAKSRNSQRWSDVTAILHGLKHYQVDNNGALPPNFPEDQTIVGNGDEGTYDLGNYLVPENLPKVPQDPTRGSAEYTCYSVQNVDDLLIVRAECTENIQDYGEIELKW
ncbi:prepilin-type N-terminal cleavage/methylation domain-containing protein [Patescibacteria group bacterium]|nr:prepilin-type N-terminal cleavage/methylation domain-containing protein [Patescibacteria group bacterium]MBU1672985.1 prepilin-type N-terminal cleavage/methylation domain-containing protein [Patescibacteria group bacterium]MBU1962980.1 prepilin-type N-terminal cleavage/methylation domain-containing protein [Patescibacteria group bacterium]